MLLLERAIAASTAEIVYFNGAAVAYRWAEAAERELLAPKTDRNLA